MCLGVAGSAAPGLPGGPCSQTASGAPGTSSNTLGGKLFLTSFSGWHRGVVAEQGSKYQKFSWSDKFDTGLVTIADIADAAFHNKHYDPYWASPLYSSSPATCSAAGGPGTGTLQCVDIGDIGTIALYKGISATDPIPLSQYTGLDPHFDRFDSGVAAPSGSVYLGSTQVLKGATSVTFDTYKGQPTPTVPTPTTITSACALGTTGLTTTEPTTGAACASPVNPPSGPTGLCNGVTANGLTTFTCTFAAALAPDLNGDTEVEITLAFSDGHSTEVEIGQYANSLIVGFTYAPPFPTPGQTVSFTSSVTGSPGYTPVAPLTYAWTFGDGATSSVANPTHAYGAAGTFTATLTVTDAAGVSGTQSFTVVVAPFSVDFTCAKTNVAFQVKCTAVTTAGNPPFTYTWTAGVTPVLNADGSVATFTYTAAGTDTINLSVTDTSGPPANTATASHSIAH